MKVARRRSKCKVCQLPPEQRQEVNAAIWDGSARQRFYRDQGKRAYEGFGGTINVKAITRHAEHVERDWREVSEERPALRTETPVFPDDYESLTDAAAAAGARALGQLADRAELGTLDDREMLGLAKLGLGARQKQRELEQDKNRPQVGLVALFGLSTGHVRVPEGEVIEGVSTEALRATVHEERVLLEARSVGAEEDDDD